MPITADEAARIAKANGLGLSDAVALQRLSNTTAEAEAFAAQFAPEAPPVDMNVVIRKQVTTAAAKRAVGARGAQ